MENVTKTAEKQFCEVLNNGVFVERPNGKFERMFGLFFTMVEPKDGETPADVWKKKYPRFYKMELEEFIKVGYSVYQRSRRKK